MMNRSPQSPNRNRRSGFTLMEMMLVVVVLAAMGAIAWPLVSRAYEGVKLKNAALDVRAAFNRARVEAMTSGVARAFHFVPSTGNYSVDIVQDGSEAVEGNGTTTNTGTSRTSGSACTYTLPDGFVFQTAERTLDSRASMAESALSGTGIDTSTPPVLFYPDGTASEATVTIANQYGRSIAVSLRGLTGISRLGEVMSADATGATSPPSP